MATCSPQPLQNRSLWAPPPCSSNTAGCNLAVDQAQALRIRPPGVRPSPRLNDLGPIVALGFVSASWCPQRLEDFLLFKDSRHQILFLAFPCVIFEQQPQPRYSWFKEKETEARGRYLKVRRTVGLWPGPSGHLITPKRTNGQKNTVSKDQPGAGGGWRQKGLSSAQKSAQQLSPKSLSQQVGGKETDPRVTA